MNKTKIAKRLTALVMCLIMLVASIPVLAAVSFGFVGTAKTDNVKIYTSASTTSTEIATIKKNVKVAIDVQSGSFYRVVLDPSAATPSYGWVEKTSVTVARATANSKVTAINATVSGSATGASGYIGNCNSYVNWRETASNSGKKLGTLKKNQAVTILGTQGSFTKVSVDGKVGYVSSQYVVSGSTGSSSGNAGSTSGTAGYIGNCNSYVNWRETASNSGKKLGTLKKNQAVTILGTQGSFTKVSVDGKVGYVSSQYVVSGSTGSSSSGNTGSTSGTAGYITNCNSYVNWRATASNSGKKLGTLKKNQAVTILGTEGKFTKVSVDGKVGYVSSEYVAASSGSGSGSTGAPGTTTGNKVGYDVMRVTGDPSYSKLKSSVKKLFEKAQKSNQNVIGYVYSPGGKISQPVVYGKNLKYLDKNVSSFYNVQTRNIVVTAHNNRKAASSNFMFHWMHHYQEATLGYKKCMGSCKSSTIASSMSLASSSNRLWDIAMFGYSQFELWAMYETQENEPSSTVNYNTQHLSNASSSTIQQWINYQISRANASGSLGKVFNSSVKPNDIFLTMYTCGDEYDSSTAQSRLYFFFRAVK